MSFANPAKLDVASEDYDRAVAVLRAADFLPATGTEA
jgi:hypothetical protein